MSSVTIQKFETSEIFPENRELTLDNLKWYFSNPDLATIDRLNEIVKILDRIVHSGSLSNDDRWSFSSRFTSVNQEVKNSSKGSLSNNLRAQANISVIRKLACDILKVHKNAEAFQNNGWLCHHLFLLEARLLNIQELNNSTSLRECTSIKMPSVKQMMSFSNSIDFEDDIPKRLDDIEPLMEETGNRKKLLFEDQKKIAAVFTQHHYRGLSIYSRLIESLLDDIKHSLHRYDLLIKNEHVYKISRSNATDNRRELKKLEKLVNSIDDYDQIEGFEDQYRQLRSLQCKLFTGEKRIQEVLNTKYLSKNLALVNTIGELISHKITDLNKTEYAFLCEIDRYLILKELIKTDDLIVPAHDIELYDPDVDVDFIFKQLTAGKKELCQHSRNTLEVKDLKNIFPNDVNQTLKEIKMKLEEKALFLWEIETLKNANDQLDKSINHLRKMNEIDCKTEKLQKELQGLRCNET